MVKTWKKVPSERTLLDTMTCDLCKKTSSRDDWAIENYEVAETNPPSLLCTSKNRRDNIPTREQVRVDKIILLMLNKKS